MVLSGFQKLQREKQIKVSPPSGNKGGVKGQEGQGREEEGPKVLTNGYIWAQRRWERPCPSTLHPQPSLPMDHTHTLLLAVFIFLVTDRQLHRQLDGWGDGQDNTSNRD